MATTIDRALPLSSTQDMETSERFRSLAARWKKETTFLSSTTEIVRHPAYQEIIGMGSQAVPHILRELQQRPDHWFRALRAITGADPVQPEQRGKIPEMAAAWAAWGLERGYIE